MKCKECGNDLQTGIQVCPYCGTSAVSAGYSARDEFKWNVQDFPKPHKKEDISIDWKTGKLIDRASNKIFDTDLNIWKDFNDNDRLMFDDAHRNYDFNEKVIQKKQFNAPVFDFSSVSSNDDFKPAGNYDKKEHKSLKLSDDFLSWGNSNMEDELDLNEDEIIVIEEDDKPETINRPKPYTADWNFEDEEKSENDDENFRFMKFEPDNELPAINNFMKSDFDEKDERSVLEEFKNLVETERKYYEDKDRFVYMSEDEKAKAEAVITKAEELKSAPEFSFSSLENEYHRYCEDNGIKIDSGNKEVEIEINEPSGTKVTVKTQEIDLVRALSDEDIKTKEVELEKLRQGPKNVQVSVEVNSGSRNSSVEVTRGPDGATFVKTANDEEKPKKKENKEVGGKAFKDERFWEHPTTPETRMTITDIFGPEARKFTGKTDKGKGVFRDKGDIQKDLNDSLILDIRPEDIALSEEQTRELMLADTEAFIDEIPELEFDTEELYTKAEIEAKDVEFVDKDVEEAQGADEADKSGNDGFGRDENPYGETEENKEIEEECTETRVKRSGDIEFTGDSADTGEIEKIPKFEKRIEETEKSYEKAPEEIKEEETSTAGYTNNIESREQKEAADEIPKEDNNRENEGIEDFDSDQASIKETGENIDFNEWNFSDDTYTGEDKKKEYSSKKYPYKKVGRGFSKPIKIVIIILIILLMTELAIIGVKLFAAGSQADVFINRVEDQAFGLFYGEDM